MKQQELFAAESASPARGRPGREALQARLAAVAPSERVAPVTPEAESPESPDVILRALIDDLEEALKASRELERDMMTMLRTIVPEDEREEGAA